MILAQRSVILLFLFLFLFSPTHSYQIWDWKERQKRRLERQSKRLALSGPVIANEVIDDQDDDEDNSEKNEIRDDLPTLNVSSKDSPYALIDKFFPERELNHQFMDRYLEKKLNQTNRNDWNLGRLDPDEVWLSDGNLLVLRGGATPNRKSFDDPLAPLDDFVAPYREPKLPPPDFVPSDTGVGVALPPENEGGPNASSTPNIKTNPFKEFLFDEEKFIQEMENFHSERRAELFGPRVPPPPRIPTNPLTKLPHVEPQVEPQVQPQVVATPLPIVWKSSTTATSPPIARSSPNTTPPATPPVTTPSKGFYVSTATPSSFSFLYHNENNENNYIRNNHHSPKPVARSTTTPPSTTIATPPPPPPTPSPSTIAPTHFPPAGKPHAHQLQTTTAPPPTVRQLKPRLEKQRGPKSFFHVENFGQKISNINEIDIDNKVAEERHDHFFKRWPGTPKVTITKPFSETPIGAPFRSNRRKSKSGGGLFHPGPTLASTVISSLKPRHALSRFGLHRPAPYQQQQHYQQAAVPPPPHSTRAGSSHAQQLHHHQPPPYARRRLPHPLPPRAGSLHAQQLPPPPPLLPPQQEQPPALRRSSNGDHRYVSFHIGHRGKIGGQSWGYSYRL